MYRVKIDGKEYDCTIIENYPDGDTRVQILDPETNRFTTMHVVSEDQFIGDE